MRLHIGIFGRRNVGKSSLLNALARQDVAIVSATPGTTTDPVERPFELQPLGPVVFIDTAGIDDDGGLGEQRTGRTRKILERIEVALLVAESGTWGAHEEELLDELRRRGVPLVVVHNKRDLSPPDPGLVARLASGGVPSVETDAARGMGVAELLASLVRAVPDELVEAPPLVGDLIRACQAVVLVVPIDLEAPKGRLILPQVQTIRDILDHDAWCVVTKERELRDALDRLRESPALVITDSQAFLKVAGDVPPGTPLTSFSILFSRLKGDILTFAQGAAAIDHLRSGDRVLMAEACSHHPVGDDIGRVKIPRWLRQYAGGHIEFDHVQGHDFPADPTAYRLIVHCGACMLTRREVLGRVAVARARHVPITNYGMAIAHSLGLLERALAPFPAALEAYRGGRLPAVS
jgi:[FeFe] hydrogenase H-cluster maturation GTPase HydF